MMRNFTAIVAGLATFTVVEVIASQIARTMWPAYALAFPTRAYTLDMLLARQAAGMLCAISAGAVAAQVSKGNKRSVLLTGLLMLLIAVVWHIRIWDQYPVWYHLLLFAYLVPLVVLGGRIAGDKRISRA